MGIAEQSGIDVATADEVKEARSNASRPWLVAVGGPLLVAIAAALVVFGFLWLVDAVFR